jgi:hypothetical protein
MSRDPLMDLPACPLIPWEREVAALAGCDVSWCGDVDGGGAFFWTTADGRRAVVYHAKGERPTEVVIGTPEECARHLWRKGHRAKMTFSALRGGD